MDDPRDYYRILHVHPDAPTEIIRSSYRTLMQRLKRHPDLGGDHEHAALINEAYATLTDPAKRGEYDRQRTEARKTPDDSGTTPQPSSPEKTSVSWHSYRSTGLCHCGFCEAAHDHGADAPEDALCNDCGSPLKRTERHRGRDSGVRALERFPKEQVIRFYTGWPDSPVNAGRSRDISLDGMQFETSRRLTVNQMIKIDCDVCRAVARVAHVRQNGSSWVVGVEFLTLMFEKVQGTFVSAEV